jgi:hypothetical protein
MVYLNTDEAKDILCLKEFTMENKREEILEKLVSFYKSIPSINGKNFFDDLLHESCENAEKCWKNYKKEDKEAKEAPWNYFSLPFIGKKYKGDLVCVGVNVHKGGGRNLQETCIRGYTEMEKEFHENDKRYGYKYDPGVIESFMKESLKIKQKPRQEVLKVSFEIGMQKAVDVGDLKKPKKGKKPYEGTELWHRTAVYSAILLEKWSSDVSYDFEKLAEIYEHIIFMDAVKCSPNTNNSNLNDYPIMEETCIKNILFKELEIIKPKNILFMNHLAAEMVRKNYKYIDGLNNFPGNGKDYASCKLEIKGENVNVYYIVHPSCRGRGNRKDLFERFAGLVNSKK